MTETTENAVRGTAPGRYVIDRAENIPLGSRRIVTIEGRSIGILNVDNRFYALRNNCPHHGAPLCEGVVKGTMQDSAPHEYQYGRHNEFIVCPWHGYEFALATGKPLLEMERTRVAVYRVTVEDGDVVLYL